jgi:hypothetical protein
VRGGDRFQSPPGKKKVILWQGSWDFRFLAMLLPQIARRWNERRSSRFDALAGPRRGNSMESEGAAGLWLFAVLGGPAILAAALIYGAWQWRHRRRRQSVRKHLRAICQMMQSTASTLNSLQEFNENSWADQR